MDSLSSFPRIIEKGLRTPFGGKGGDPMVILFSNPADEVPVPYPGTYKLHVEAITFEEGRDVEAELAVIGLVHGLGGTDEERHDLVLGLLWGMPIALTFGLVGAVGTSLAQMLLAGISAWYGGWVDGLIQRITEVNIVTINFLFGKTIWHILGIIVLLSIFGSGIKNYRAVFLQVKEDPYIEAAKAYGASNSRIIFHYLVPRIMPMLIPRLIMLIPGYVFIEATLAFLGVGDLYIPTWGKLISNAISSLGIVEKGYYYIVLEPVIMLLVTGFAFSLLGIALERILNPRLHDS
jgi:peptide/nickel transport system permease protein